MTRKITAVILAGGKSSRFKQSTKQPMHKAFALLHGKPLLQKIIESISDSPIEEIIISIDSEQTHDLFRSKLEQLFPTMGETPPIQFVTDKRDLPAKGPLLGIVSAAKEIKEGTIFILPCDLVITASEVQTVVEVAQKARFDEIITVKGRNGTINPTILITPSSLIQRLLSLIPAGFTRGRPTDLIRIASQIQLLDFGYELPNVNTKDQLHELNKKVQTAQTQESQASKQLLESCKVLEDVFSAINEENFGQALKLLNEEYRCWQDKQQLLLARHALKDLENLSRVA